MIYHLLLLVVGTAPAPYENMVWAYKMGLLAPLLAMQLAPSEAMLHKTGLLAPLLALQLAPNSEPRMYKMGLLVPWNQSYDFSGYTSASAVTIALERVRADPELNANGQIELR